MTPLTDTTRPATAQTGLADVLLFVAVMGLILLLAGIAPAAVAADRVSAWSPDEQKVLASMQLSRLPALAPDESNAVADNPAAAALGKRLFDDTRLSRNGAVACATCHDASRQFQDDRPVGQGVGTGKRRTMPVAASAHSAWFFWDGRKDSQWSQALGPLEDSVEHGGNRLRFVRTLQAHYAREYAALFGPLPDLRGLPDDASPVGSAEERKAWAGMTDAQRDQVNRAFANLGKAIAAYERTVGYGESRFDRYVAAVLAGDRAARQTFTPQEANGLRLFIGKAQCATCHNGPLLSDQAFHNTGVPPRDPAQPDAGRGPATAKVLADEFNCLGRYSDASAAWCQELQFVATDEPGLTGAFKTPGLRNVALRPPYMHAGQFATLEDAIAHYVRAPAAAVGHSELAHGGKGHADRQPIRLNDAEVRDLAAFLRTLSGPIVERAAR